VLIVGALYGMKSASPAFRNHLAECMKHLGLNHCHADRYLWMKTETRPDDGMLSGNTFSYMCMTYCGCITNLVPHLPNCINTSR
jgi:hypothetical protein